MKREVATQLLKENRESYDRMAREFSSTRERFWSELAFLAEHAMPGMRVLDIGCGNGRFYPLLSERQVDYVGVDNSRGLLDEARKKYPGITFTEGDATALPFPDRTFDIAFSFATIHHIPSAALRARFVAEAARVLKPGAPLIITTWFLREPPYRRAVLKSMLTGAFHIGGLDTGEIMLTFGKQKHARYLHAFTMKEFEALLAKNGFQVIGSDIVTREPGAGVRQTKRPTQKNLLIVARKK
jgi:ubiquinone/menaquinone biosynthesis C-methylase UbiE